MSVMELLGVLAEKNIKLWLEGDALRFSAPADVFDSELKAQVVAQKSAIIAFLKEAQKSQVQTIPKADRKAPIPLSLTQQRLWILNQLEPDSVAYNMPIILKLLGDFKTEYFEVALRQVVARHESMRTQIVQEGLSAYQDISIELLPPIVVDDISELTSDEQETRIKMEVERELKTPFSLGIDPLFRVRLLKTSANKNQQPQHILMMCMHHIVTDGWSLGLVVQEIITYYNAFLKQPDLDKRTELNILPELDIQYADFSVWQRQWLAGKELERQLNFWREYLPRDGFVLNLPTDYERVGKSQLAGSTVSRLVPLTVLENFKGLIKKADATLFMGLLSIFDVLLAKYSNQSQINIGTPNAGRNRIEVEGVVGFFISTLVMSAKVEKQDRFIDVLKQVKDGAVATFSNQDVPFEKLVEELKPERDLSRTPLFQVFFNLLNLPELEQSFDGIKIESLLADDVDQVSKFDMTLYAKEGDDGLRLDVIYNSYLYTKSRMDVMLEHFERLLKAVSESPNTTIEELSLLGLENEITSDANTESVAVFQEASSAPVSDVMMRITTAAEIHAQSIAIKGQRESWSYAELGAGVQRLASHLKQQAVSGARVACLVSRTAQLPLSLLSVLTAKCSFSIIDIRYPLSKIKYYLTALNADYVIVDESVVEIAALSDFLESQFNNRCLVLPESKAAFFAHDVLNIGIDDTVSDQKDIDRLVRNIPLSEVAYYGFTSGTQGEPKLIANDLTPLSHFVDWYEQEFQLGADDCFSLLSGVAHDPVLRDIFVPLAMGATLCIPEQNELLEPGYLSQWITQNKVTVAHLTPSMGELMVQSWNEKAACLRLVCFGGEKLHFSQAQEFALFADSAQLVNFYGATETPQAIAFERIDMEQTMGRSNIIPIGKGIEGAELVIVNANLNPVGVSEVGEIVVRTPYLSKGYENDEELTASKFPSMARLSMFDGQASQKGEQRERQETVYRTGDLGRYLPDGRVQLIDRLDGQIKVRGFRVEPGEIENALKKHEQIKAAAVTLVEINGVQQLATYVVQTNDDDTVKTVQKGDLIDLLRLTLPDYMIPQAVVWLDDIPLTPNGKTDYKNLPIPGHEDRAANYLAARNAVEEQLVLIWEEILNTSPIGVNDSFFELGGHSLLATQVVSRINSIYQLNIALRVIFEKPTIAAISILVESELTAETGLSVPTMSRVSREKRIPISFAQNRLWFMQKLDPSSTAFNMPFPLKLTGKLDCALLERVYQEIFKRHEILGVNILEEDGQPFLQFNSLANWSLDQQTIDVASMGEAELSQLQKQLAITDASLPFNLASDSLIRVKLYTFDRGNTEIAPPLHLLLMTVHHVISDGWSMNVFMQEILSLYNAFALKLPSPLTPLKIQYADYAHWQRDYLQGDALESQLDYWETKLKGSPQVLRLPTDKARPAMQTFNGNTYSKVLSKSLVSDLNGFSQQHQLSLFMTLIGAYQILLSRYTDTNDVCVGIPIAGRHHGDTENIIGLFLNGLIVRAQFGDNPTVDEFYARIKETLLEAYAHQDLPIEMLFDRLDYARDPAYPTGVQVGFQLQNMNNVASVEGAQGATLSDGLAVEMLEREQVVAKYDMTWILEERDGLIEVLVEYNQDLFFESSIARMITHYETLLRGVVSGDYHAIRALPLVDRKNLISEIGVTECDHTEQIDAVYPLTMNQQSIYFAALMDSNTLANSFGVYVDIPTLMDRDIMARAFTEIYSEQSIMRIKLVESKKAYLDSTYQVFYQNRNPNIEFLDWSNETLSESQITQRVNELVFRTYEIHGELLFCHIVKVTEERFLVVLASHHVIFDGIGLAGLVYGLRDRYLHIVEGTDIAEWPDRYKDYILHELNYADVAETQAFWRDRLPSSLEAIVIPQPSRKNIDGELEGRHTVKKSILLSPEHWASVRKYSRKNKITPALYFKVLYGVLLQRYSQCEETFYIDEMTGSRQKGYETVAGAFAQALPFVFDKSCFEDAEGQPATMPQLIANVRAFQKSLKGKTLWSEQKQADLLPRANQAFLYNFIPFVVALDFLGKPSKVHDLINHVSGTVEFTVVARKEEIRFDLTYASDEFEDFDFLKRIVWVSEQIVAGNDNLNLLDLVFDDEKTKLLEQSGESVEYDSLETIPALFEQQVQRCPDKMAVVFDDVSLTYTELNALANEFALKMRDAGIGRNHLVALYANRSHYFLAAILGVMKNGAAYVPIDPKYPSDRIAYMLDDSKVTVIVSERELVAQLEQEVLTDTHVIYIDECHPLGRSEAAPTEFVSVAQPKDRAYMIYTSGSTGKPKGALLHHDGALNHILAECDVLDFDGAFNFLQSAPSSSDISVWQFLGPVVRGGTSVILDDVIDIPKLFRLLRQEQIDIAELVPVVLQMVVAHALSLEEEARALPHLRWMMVTGEAAPVELVNRWLAIYPNIPVVNAYGPTEASDDVIQAIIREPLSANEITVPIGKPLPNLNVLILDQQGRLLPNGITGEICIGGVGVGEGYWNKPDKTQEVFVANQFEQIASDHLYRSGDLGRWSNKGDVEFVGRIDTQVQLRGFRIELGEIEAQLVKLEGIKEAVCVAFSGEQNSQHQNSQQHNLAAYLTLSQGGSKTELDLASARKQLADALPDYMVPNSFTILEKLPLTPAGKVDRKALPEPEEFQRQYVEMVEPRNEIETALVSIWKDVLRVKAVSVYDDFFELGGHSLLGTQVVARVRDSLQVDLPIRTVFQFSVLASLALEIEQEKSRGGKTVAPILPVSREGHLPISPNQRRLWFLYQLDPKSTAYNMPVSAEVVGDIDVPKFEQALSGLVKRQEILRTRFVDEEGECVQIVDASASDYFHYYDLTSLTAEERVIKKSQITQKNQYSTFDLGSKAGFRVALTKEFSEKLPKDDSQSSSNTYTLMICMHHMISDGWSMRVLIKEWLTLYVASTEKMATQLPLLPVQYSDYASWQVNLLEGRPSDRISNDENPAQQGSTQNQLNYWKDKLAGAEEVLQLPVDFPRLKNPTNKGASVELKLNDGMAKKIDDCSRQTGVTPFMLMLTAYQVLLSRYSNQQDILVGIPIAGREYKEVQDLIGFFVNTLAIRSEIDTSKTFLSLLSEVKQSTLDAFSNQDVPFDQVIDAVGVERTLSFPPLVQVAFQLHHLRDLDAEMSSEAVSALSGFELKVLAPERSVAKFDLMIEVFQGANEVSVKAEYNADLFVESTIQQLLNHYVNLVEQCLGNVNTTIADIELLSEQEQELILREFNNNQVDYPQVSVDQLFDIVAEKNPDQIAIIQQNQTITYRDLQRKSNQVANVLLKKQVKPGDHVGLCIDRSIEFVISLLGILKVGAAYVPLDSTYPDERLAYMISDTRVAVLLTEQTKKTQLSQVLASVEHDTAVLVYGEFDDLLEAASSELEPRSVAIDTVCYVMYTSGSTGRPKGVQVSHRAVMRLVQNTNFLKVNPNDRIGFLSNTAFDASTLELWTALTNGLPLVVVTYDQLLEPEQFETLVKSERVSVMFLTTSLMHEYAQNRITLFDSLRVIIFGGEACDLRYVKRILDIAKPDHIINGYGPTENTVFTTCYDVQSIGSMDVSIPIGKPLANTSVYILDQNRRPVPIGVSGELYTGGDGVALGYLNKDDLTHDVFVDDPFSAVANAKMYRTGDLARFRPDGNVEYLGRRDNQVKIRGFRIELDEIEMVISGQPSVQQSLVLDWKLEDGRTIIVAYYVPTSESNSAHNDDLHNDLHCALVESLPGYMVPQVLIPLESMPLTPNGKLDRRALPEPDLSALSENYKEPTTDTEKLLCELWSSLLATEKVGINDNFFDLGGHSLLATRFVSKLRKERGIELPLKQIFNSPTIAQLAKIIDDPLSGSAASSALILPPLEPRSEKEYSDKECQALELSYAQQRLWFIDQLEESSAAYNMPVAVRFKGELNLEMLERAFNTIVERHESLRTVFAPGEEKGGQAIQVIQPMTKLHIVLDDLSDKNETEKPKLVRRLVNREAMSPFDLSKDVLLRARIIRVAHDEHIVLATMHHIASDGWSVGVLIQELQVLYQTYLAGGVNPLPPLPIQYADYAQWQRGWLQGEVLEAELAYWRDQLAGIPQVHSLPLDHSRPSKVSFKGARFDTVMEAKLSASINDLSKQQGTTLFMTLQAAFAVLLARYSGEQDIVLGSPIANRTDENLSPLIGFFVNTLVLRTQIQGDPSFVELLADVKQTALDAYEHQHIPFEMLVEAINPDRNMTHSPLFQVLFAVQNNEMSEVALPGLTLSPLEQEETVAKFDLSLTMSETPNGLATHWIYCSDLFDAESIEQLSTHFITLLEGIIADKDQSVFDIPLLSPAERSTQLLDWNNTDKDYPNVGITELIEERVVAAPTNIALVFEGKTLTYAELNSHANRLARLLMEQGVQPDQLVGICVDRSFSMIIGMLGVLKAGGAYVPLDPDHPADRLSYMIEDLVSHNGSTGSSIILTQTALQDRVPSSDKLSVYRLDDAEFEKQVNTYDDSNIRKDELSDLTTNHLAYLIFTSGSTGKPKGVMIEHHGLVNRVDWMLRDYPLNIDDRVLLKTPYSFDVSVLEIYWTLAAGATLVIAQPGGHRDPHYLVETIVKEAITQIQFVPSMLTALLSSEDWARCQSIKRVLVAGEALPTELLHRFYRTDTNAELHNIYGPTEAVVYASAWMCPKDHPHNKPVPIGKPVANVKLYVLDQKLRLLPAGVAGELYIAGSGLARGYLNLEELSLKTFIADPLSDEANARMYKTGDVVRYLPDGNIEYLGRNDHQVKVRGFRIELGEIENQLMAHPAITEATVIANDNRLVAYVVFDDGTYQGEEAALNAASLLKKHLLETLPSYMVPAVFMVLDAMPLTSSGKVDRNSLPDPDLSSLTETYVAPINEIQEVLCDVWSELLDVDRVGIEDNFFNLGGHSLLVTQLAAQLRKAFDIELSVRELFEHATVAEQTIVVEEKKQQINQSNLPDIQRRANIDPIPLTYGQQRIWMMGLLNPDSAAFNMPGTFKLAGELDLSVLEMVMQTIVQRHDTLRTHFQTNENGDAFMVVDSDSDIFGSDNHNEGGSDSEGKWSLPVIDLSDVSPEELEQKINQQLRNNETTPFDLLSGPLFRLQVLALPQEAGVPQHIILFCMHHIISDGGSIGVLTQELVRGYAGGSLTGEVTLPVLPIQYADYALWQRTHLDNQVIDRQIEYWKNYLEGSASFLRMPTDYPRPAQQTTSGDRVRFDFPIGFSASLNAVCAELGVTPFMFMLTSYQLLLSHYAQQDDVLVGVPIAGRDQAELQGLIGFFINSVVIRGDMSDNKTVRSLMQNTREDVLNAFSNQDVPAERILQDIQFDRDPAYPPLVQVAFQLLQAANDSASIMEAMSNGGMGDFEFEGLGLERVESKLDMTLELHLSTDEIVAFLEYNTDLFNSKTMTTFLRHYVSLTQAMISNLDLPCRSLDWMTEGQLIESLGVEISGVETSGVGASVWPLTAMQRDIYLDSVMNPGNHRNNIGFVVDMHSAIDPLLMQRCLNDVAAANSMLRAHFIEAPFPYMDFVYQVIPNQYEVNFQFEDWTSKAAADIDLNEDDVQRLAEAFVYRPIAVKDNKDLTHYKLIKLSDERFLILVAAHHIVTDGVALVQNAKEVIGLYETLNGSLENKLTSTEANIQKIESHPFDNYADHVAEDRQAMDTADTLAFWRGMLADAESLHFRMDNKASKSESRGSKVSKQLPLDDALWQKLKKYCRKNRITPAHYFKCIYGYLLNSYCGAEKDFPIMELALGRRKENMATLGCYYQQVPFLMRQKVLNNQMTMQDIFADARTYQKEIKNYRNISVFAQNTILATGPVTFLYNFNAYFEGIVFNGQAHNNIGLLPDVDNQVLLSVKVANDELYLIMHYYDHLFDDVDFLERMEWISQQLLAGTDSLGDLKLVLPNEEAGLVDQAMASTVEHMPYRPLVQLIEEQVKQSHSQIAVRCGDDFLSFAELDRRSALLAKTLRQQGAKEGAIVGVCLAQDCNLVVALLAVLKTGAAYLPMDLKHPKERLLFMESDSSACFVLTDSVLQQEITFSKAVLFSDLSDTETSQSVSDELFQSSYAKSDSLFYVIYTSGSTGQPKGSGVLQQGVFNLQQWYCREFEFDSIDQHLMISAVGFDLSQKNLWAPLLSGGTLHFVDAQDYDPQKVIETIEQQHITRINCAPSAFYPLVEDRRYSSLSSLKTVILGGESIRMASLRDWLESDDCLCKVVNSYGPTECTDIASYYVVSDPAPYFDNNNYDNKGFDKNVPLGVANDNVQLWVVDRNQQLLPQGLVGELLIGGQGVGAGYLNRQELEDKVFIQTPIQAERTYLTGDLVYWDKDNLLQYVGRSDFQVKLRGQRIELGEIEFALKQIEGAKDSLVLLHEDRLLAYVLSDDDSLAQTDWRLILRDYLLDYMVPSSLLVLKSWPLNANGKIDRHALPKDIVSDVVRYVAPTTALEITLADILRSVLKVERVGIYDSFFDLGGHSLLATQVVARVRTQFNVELPLRKLFETPTVAGLAEIIEHSQRVEQLDMPPIVAVDRSEPIPLSFAQQRLFVLQELDHQSAAYNMFTAVRIKGDLNIESFASSFDRLVERHESLRTTFQVDEDSGQVYQVIHASEEYNRDYPSLTTIDLRHLDAGSDENVGDVVEAEVKGLVAMDAMTAFDLRTGPLMRATLYQLDQQEFVLVANMHHIVSDGWSLGVLVREIALLYFSQGGSPLPALPIQYPDYAHWQRSWLQGDVLEKQLTYWRDHLEGVPNLELPTDFTRLPVQGAKGAHVSFTFSREISQAIYEIGQAQGCTPFMTLLAVFNVLLYRHSGQTDFAVGSPIANRTQEVLEPLIGVFVNTLCLRTAIDPQQSFSDYLSQVKTNTLTAYDHQDVPFERIVDELNVARDMSHTPLFQAMFMLQNTPTDQTGADGLVQSGLQFEALETDVELAKFDITLSMQEVDGQFTGQFAYRDELFEASSVQRFVDHFKTLLAELAVNTAMPVSVIKLLSSKETDQQLHQWNSAERDYNREESVVSRIEQQVALTPDQTAVIWGDVSLSYLELNQQANQVAHGLIASGVNVGDRVGLCLERSAEMMVALLGIIKSGATYVPLDASYPQERLHYMVENAELVSVVTHEATQVLFSEGVLASDIETHTIKSLTLKSLTLKSQKLNEGQNDSSPKYSQENPDITISAEQLLYVIFTSGSTGLPKATGAVHRAEINLINWYTREFDMGLDDRIMIVSSVGFDLTQKNFFAPLVCGATCVLPRSAHFDYLEITEEVERSKVTWINCAPSAFYPLVEEAQANENFSGLASLRWVFLGGEAIQVNRLRNWLNHSQTQLVNSYGPTECADIAAYYVLDKEKDLSREDIPLGKPNDNVRLYVLDEQQALMPAGCIGEIHIGGESVGPGYLNDETLTQQQFSLDPYNQAPSFANAQPGRLYATGDLGRYNQQGEVEYLGRRDNQIKLRGYRIELGEIESALSLHKAVTLAVVVLAGNGDRLACYLQLASGRTSDKTVDAAQLQAFLKQSLPDYMVPSQFMVLDSFPLTPNGKVDRNHLPQMSEEESADYVAAQTQTEEVLSEIWRGLLDSTTDIGRYDNFFARGGNSIVGVQMMSAVEKQFDVTLALATLFKAQTLMSLAAEIEEAQKNRNLTQSTGVLVPIQEEGSKTPIFCIHAVGGEVLAYHELSRALGDEQPFYGLQAKGLQKEELPISDIKEMASDYIKAIQTVQPSGPYRLAGHSLGGMIAYEMAQQLLASGETVAKISLFDTFMPDKTNYNLNDDVDYLQAIFVNPDGSELLPLPKAHLRSLDEQSRLVFVFEKAQQVGVVPKGVSFEQTVRLFTVAKTNMKVVNAYEPKPIACSVEHFCATRTQLEFSSQEGWSDLVTDLQQYRVDTHHEGIIRGAAVIELVELMGN